MERMNDEKLLLQGRSVSKGQIRGGVRSEHYRQRADVGIGADRVCMAWDNYNRTAEAEACYIWRTGRDSGDYIVIWRY